LSSRAPFSQQDKNSTISKLHNTWPGTSFFYLPQQLIPPSSPTPRPKAPHTPPPLLSMASSDAASWPWYGHPVISQTVRMKSR
jgi:hypothetical protein